MRRSNAPTARKSLQGHSRQKVYVPLSPGSSENQPSSTTLADSTADSGGLRLQNPYSDCTSSTQKSGVPNRSIEPLTASPIRPRAALSNSQDNGADPEVVMLATQPPNNTNTSLLSSQDVQATQSAALFDRSTAGAGVGGAPPITADDIERVVADAGCTRLAHEFHLGESLDHSEFVKRLAVGVAALIDGDRARHLFFDRAFKQLCAAPNRLAPLLRPTQSEYYGAQDSVARALLLVEPVQQDVAAALLDTMRRCSHQKDGQATAQLILQQFRYLPSVGDSEKMRALLCRVEASLAAPLRYEFVRVFPELIHDVHAQNALVSHFVQSLSSGSSSDVQYTAAVLECVTHLQMSADVAAQLCDYLLLGISREQLRLLPDIVQLYLCAAPELAAKKPQIMLNHISALLNRIADCLFTRVSGVLSQSFSGQAPVDQPVSHVVAAVEPLIERAQYCTPMMLATLKYCAALTPDKPITNKLVVFVVLLGVHRLNRWQKRVTDTLRALLKAHALGADVLTDQTAIVSSVFGAALAVCDLLLPDAQPVCRRFGSKLAALLFQSAHEQPERQQDVIMCVCAHINSNTKEAAAALDCLHSLLAQPAQLQPYAIFIQSRLDDLEMLESADAKWLLRVLCALAVTSDDPGDTLLGELKIRFSKLLHVGAYKSLGLLGELSLLTEMIKHAGISETEVTAKFIYLKAKCADSHMKSLLFAELGQLLTDCDAGIQCMGSVLACAVNEIESKYLPAETSVSSAFETERAFGIGDANDDDSSDGVVHLIGGGATELPALLRIVQRFVLCHNADAEAARAQQLFLQLLGAQLLLPSQEAVEDIGTLDGKHQQRVIDALWCAVNWCVQLVNSVCSKMRFDGGGGVHRESDQHHRRLLLHRFRHQLQLQRRLLRACKGVTTFTLPCAAAGQFTMNETVESATGKRGRKRKADETTATNLTADDSAGPSSSTAKTATPTRGARARRTCHNAIRQLRQDQLLTQLLQIDDNSLLRVLSLPVQTNTIQTSSTQQARPQSSLGLTEYIAAAALFLKRPIARPQLQHKQFSSSEKNWTLTDVDQYAAWFNSVRGLLQHADKHFKRAEDESDGVIDAALDDDDAQLLLAVQHSLNALHKLLLLPALCNNQDALDCLLTQVFPIDKRGGDYIESSLTYLLGLHCTHSLSCAAALLQLARAIAQLDDAVNLPHALTQRAKSLCVELLRRDWEPEELKGAGATHIGQLLSAYYTFGEDTVALCAEQCQQLLTASALPAHAPPQQQPAQANTTFTSICSQTFLKYYQAVWEHLIIATIKQPDRYALLTSDASVQSHLASWLTILGVFNDAVNLCAKSKYGNRQPVLRECVRQARKWLQEVNKENCGLNVLLEKHLKAETLADFTLLIRRLSGGRRMLFRVVDTVKSNKRVSSGSLQQLSEMGRCLDMQMLRMQRALRVAGLHNALQVGRLKHKNMQGEELSASVEFDEETPPSSYEEQQEQEQPEPAEPPSSPSSRSSSRTQAPDEVDLFGSDEDEAEGDGDDQLSEHF